MGGSAGSDGTAGRDGSTGGSGGGGPWCGNGVIDGTDACDGIDQGGCTNTLTDDTYSPGGAATLKTCLVEMEKV